MCQPNVKKLYYYCIICSSTVHVNNDYLHFYHTSITLLVYIPASGLSVFG